MASEKHHLLGFNDPQSLCALLDQMAVTDRDHSQAAWNDPTIAPADGTCCPFSGLPIEIRQKIYYQYLFDAAGGPDLQRHRHVDKYNNECCTWNWPEELIVCDKEKETVQSALNPFFLPKFCLANKQLMGEVARYMLRTTKHFIIKGLDSEHSPVKMSQYFLDFLSTISVPGYDAFDDIKDLILPHFSHRRPWCVEQNPDIPLILRCKNLRQLRLTFHASAFMTFENPYNPASRFAHKTLDQIIRFFHLDVIHECESLQELYLEGIRPSDRDRENYPTNSLKMMINLGVWIKERFLSKRGKDVKVLYTKRKGVWTGQNTWAELQIPDKIIDLPPTPPPSVDLETVEW